MKCKDQYGALCERGRTEGWWEGGREDVEGNRICVGKPKKLCPVPVQVGRDGGRKGRREGGKSEGEEEEK